MMECGGARLYANPKLPEAVKEALLHHFKKSSLPGEQWFLSSGSTWAPGQWPKIVVHTEQTLHVSAESVVRQFSLGSRSRLHLSLPEFHVGGSQIIRRAHIAGAQWVRSEMLWSAQAHCNFWAFENITHCSLVPTQLYDLVREHLSPPKSLELAFIGGSRLSRDLYDEAKHLGWPLMPVYGATETGSMIAMMGSSYFDQSQKSPSWEMVFHTLPHARVDRTPDETLQVWGESVAKALWTHTNGVWIRKDLDGVWDSRDLCKSVGSGFVIRGRFDNFVKINGEGVCLEDVELRALFILRPWGVTAVLCLPEEEPRSGVQLHYLLEASEAQAIPDLGVLREKLRSDLLPVELPWKATQVRTLPRNHMGKLQRTRLV